MQQDGEALLTAKVMWGVLGRFAFFTPADFLEVAGRYPTAEAFADRYTDPGAVSAPAARSALAAAWQIWERQGRRGEGVRIDPFAASSPLQRHIATAVGATGFRPATEPSWGREMIGCPDGYILDTPRGRVFLDAAVVDREVWLSEFSVERRAGGLGTAIMEAIRDYADARGLGARVFKVTNPGFFARFEWLAGDYPRPEIGPSLF